VRAALEVEVRGVRCVWGVSGILGLGLVGKGRGGEGEVDGPRVGAEWSVYSISQEQDYCLECSMSFGSYKVLINLI